MQAISPVEAKPFPKQPTSAAALALMPNMFVIGASKAGSSALHSYLRQHPQICMSSEKEPCFFVDQDELEAAWPIMARQRCSHNWDAYLDLYRGGEDAVYRGEGSVYYSQSPHRSGVPARIADSCPDARIIYTVREPVRRAIGHYWQRFKEFQEPLGLDEAVRSNAIYRDTSDYAMQLKLYLEHFDPSQVKVIVAEDLREKRREVLADVIAWLGLDPYNYSDEEITERHASPKTSRKERFPLVSKMRDSSAWSAARKHLPGAMVDKLREVSTVEFEKSDVDESGARDYLQRYLAPRRAEFERLIGRHIPQWGPLETE